MQEYIGLYSIWIVKSTNFTYINKNNKKQDNILASSSYKIVKDDNHAGLAVPMYFYLKD